MQTLQILNHLVNKVSKAEVHEEPFSHFYIDREFMPQPVYDKLLAVLPYLKSTYTPLSTTNYIRPDGTPTREQIVLSEWIGKGKLHSAVEAVLEPLYAALLSIEFKNAVFAALAPGLLERFGCKNVNDIYADRDIRIFRDTEDYEILPHRDTHYKRVTLQFYLPKDNRMSNMGTSLYTEKPWPASDGSIITPGTVWDQYEEFKRFPFQPNTGYAFVVCKGKRNSWHGRRRLTTAGVERNTLMVIFEDRREQAKHPD